MKNIVLEKIKSEFLFTFKDLRFFLADVNQSVLVKKEKDMKINSRKDVLFGNLNFINSLLKSKLIPVKTVFNFSRIALEKYVNAKASTKSESLSDIFLEIIIKLLEFCG